MVYKISMKSKIRHLEHLEIIDPATERETTSPLCSAMSDLHPKNEVRILKNKNNISFKIRDKQMA